MKPMRTELVPLRRKRCEAVIGGCETNKKIVIEEIAYLARWKPRRFLAMLTDEAVEELAFKAIADRLFAHRIHARNRALNAAIRAEATP